jgi:hypothetical protein
VSGLVNVGVSATFGGIDDIGDAATAFGTGFMAGLGPSGGGFVASRLIGLSSTGRAVGAITGGAVGSGGGEAITQGVGDYRAGRPFGLDWASVGIAATGGALGAAATLPLGNSFVEIVSGGIIGSQFDLGAGAANAIYGRSVKP